MGIMAGIIAAGIDSGIERGFLTTITACSTAAWSPAHMTHCRKYCAESDKRFADFRAKEAQGVHERRFAGSKKAAVTRRLRGRAGRLNDPQRTRAIIDDPTQAQRGTPGFS
jgi:hypothetical protein